MAEPDPKHLVVRKAPLPYYMPYVIVCEITNRVIGHFRTEQAAKQELGEYKSGQKIPAFSEIQRVNDPIKAQESRMKHPFGEPRTAAPLMAPGLQRKRTIHL